MAAPIVVVGVPTALGGHLAGHGADPERAARARAGRIGCGRGPDWPPSTSATPATSRSSLGSGRRRPASEEPRRDLRVPAARAGPRRRIARGRRRTDARLLVLGGDCTAHAGALAGLRAARPGRRFAIAWFDAHGDFNTPDTTPSGNVWGMPFAMICGRGDPDLVGACDGPTVREEDAALLGGQVLDETESRMLAASRVAALRGRACSRPRRDWRRWTAGHARSRRGSTASTSPSTWTASIASGGWAVTMPEPDGLVARDRHRGRLDPAGRDAGRRLRADRGDAVNGDAATDRRRRRRARGGRLRQPLTADRAPSVIDRKSSSSRPRPIASQLIVRRRIDDEGPAAVVGARRGSRSIAERGLADVVPLGTQPSAIAQNAPSWSSRRAPPGPR